MSPHCHWFYISRKLYTIVGRSVVVYDYVLKIIFWFFLGRVPTSACGQNPTRSDFLRVQDVGRAQKSVDSVGSQSVVGKPYRDLLFPGNWVKQWITCRLAKRRPPHHPTLPLPGRRRRAMSTDPALENVSTRLAWFNFGHYSDRICLDGNVFTLGSEKVL